MNRRRGLSRVLIEIALIVIALAAVGVVYQIFSTSTASSQNAVRVSVDGYLTTNKLVLNVKNIGNLPISSVVVSATLSGSNTYLTFTTAPSTVTITTTSPASTITPGGQIALEFPIAPALTAGQTYNVYVTVNSGSQSDSVLLKLTVQ
jgi:hypothetical protein